MLAAWCCGVVEAVVSWVVAVRPTVQHLTRLESRFQRKAAEKCSSRLAHQEAVHVRKLKGAILAIACL